MVRLVWYIMLCLFLDIHLQLEDLRAATFLRKDESCH